MSKAGERHAEYLLWSRRHIRRLFVLLTLWVVVASVILWYLKGKTLEHFPNRLSEIEKAIRDKHKAENYSDLDTSWYSPDKHSRRNHLRDESLNLSYPPPFREALVTTSPFRRQFLLWEKADKHLAASIGSDHVGTPDRYLIYRCDNSRLSYCGGWADRVKGMLFTYVVANLTGRIFKAEILDPPCNILKYIYPNVVGWHLPVSMYKKSGKIYQNMRAINKVDKRSFQNDVSTLNFTDFLGDTKTKYIFFKANLDYSLGLQKNQIYSHQLSWMTGLSNDQIMSTLYKRVFKPSPYLQDNMNKFMGLTLPTPRHRLICAHVRMGANPTIPRDTEIRFHEEDLAFVWRFLSQQSKTDYDKIFFVSDSTKVVHLGKSQSFSHRMVSSMGPINHIDKSGHLNVSERCDGLQKVIFDQHVLMQCDVLLVCLSGLSRMAAYVRGSDQGLYCLLKKGRIVPCKVRNIQNLYGYPD